MIRFLLISLLSIFALTSCSLKTTEGLREVNINKTLVENPYFANAEIDYVYKAKIEVYKRKLGGILIIKKTGPESHRIVFTTEFGSKLFDFQFDGDVFTKNFVVEDLDKKFIIDILRDDFKLLVNESAKVLSAYKSEEEIIYKTQSDKRYNFYFLDNTSEKLVKIISTSKTKEKVEIDFIFPVHSAGGTDGNIAAIIEIQHHNIKLTIDLEKFKKE